MTAQQMWEKYSTEQNISADYDAWAYGDDPDTLAQLTLEGTKTATASLRLWYGLENEELPKEGQYSVVLDSRDEAVCIIRTSKVFVCPFEEVDERQAYKEGEGDRSLAYWRKVHEAFFSEELQEAGMTFDPSMNVVCEEFEKVYP